MAVEISTALDGALPMLPGSPRFSVNALQSIKRGDPANVSELTMPEPHGASMQRTGTVLFAVHTEESPR